MIRKPKSKFYMDVGWRIRQVRSLNKLSQEYLGERLGVSAQTIQRYETGEIHIPTEAMAKCSRALHTPVGFFYGEDGQSPANSNISRVGILVAAEIMELPDDNIRKSVFHLVRAINRHDEAESSKIPD